MPSSPPDPSEFPTKNRIERFFIGFIFGALAGFFGALLYDGHFLPALISGLPCGLFVGVICALLGKRGFDFLITIITRFP